MRHTKKDILAAAKQITKWLSDKSQPHKVIDMEKTFKVVVLDDGETWAGEADIVTLTQKGYDDLMNGVKYDQLDDKDVLDVKSV